MFLRRQHDFTLTGPTFGAFGDFTGGIGLTNAKRKETRYQRPHRPLGKLDGEGVKPPQARHGTLAAGRHWTSRGKLRGFCQVKSRQKPYVPKRLTTKAPVPATINGPLNLGGFLIPKSVGVPRCDWSATGCVVGLENPQCTQRVVPMRLQVERFLVSVPRTRPEVRLDVVPG